MHLNELAKGQVALNMMKIGLKGPYMHKNFLKLTILLEFRPAGFTRFFMSYMLYSIGASMHSFEVKGQANQNWRKSICKALN